MKVGDTITHKIHGLGVIKSFSATGVVCKFDSFDTAIKSDECASGRTGLIDVRITDLTIYEPKNKKK